MVHGEVWTIKELFVYPNEYIYWTIQIVMYPFMTGLVAGAFVLSSLYHVFGVKQAQGHRPFFSGLFLCAPAGGHPAAPSAPAAAAAGHLGHDDPPLHLGHCRLRHRLFHLWHDRCIGDLVCLPPVFRGNRPWICATRPAADFCGKRQVPPVSGCSPWGPWTSASRPWHKDEKAVKILAGIGIPVACFLHGYAGFIFGSVKANALWMTPLMPVIFICSAVVSGIALCILTYIVTMEIRKLHRCLAKKAAAGVSPSTKSSKSAEIQVVTMTANYLVMFLILAITLELLDLIFRGYTAVKSWDILRSVIYEQGFCQYLRPPVRARQPGPIHPLPAAPAHHPAGHCRDNPGPDGGLHDALERGHRRAGIFILLLRIHALPSPHRAPRLGDLQGRALRRSHGGGHPLYPVLAPLQDFPGL